VESVSPLLPDEIVHRKKQGFLFPWELWMRRELKSFCEETNCRTISTTIYQWQRIAAYWKRFLNNDPSVRWTELWLFIVLGYWLDKNHIDG
jgi:asparagine synthase (glutamine-hydrolysing)